MKFENIAEVLQGEIGITSARDEKFILATTNTTTCILFYGYEKNLEIGFLCHFDFPWSTKAIPELVNKLEKLTNYKKLTFEVGMIGGLNFVFYSNWTLIRIFEEIRSIKDKSTINFVYKSREYSKLSGVTLHIDTREEGILGEYRKKPFLRKSNRKENLLNNIMLMPAVFSYVCKN